MATDMFKLSDYPTIRASIDLDLDDTGLPDSIISMPIYKGSGENMVLARDPLALYRIDPGNATYYTPENAAHIRNAAILFTASLIVLALPQIQRETMGTHYAYQKTVVDRIDLSSTLEGRGEQELDFILHPGIVDDLRPTMFTLGTANRRRRCL